MSSSTDSPPHPVQCVNQTALFFGLDGFGRMGVNGIDPSRLEQNIVAIDSNNITPRSVSEAADHVRHYRIAEVSRSIVDTMFNEVPRHVVAESVFPKFLARKEQREHQFINSITSYGYYSGGNSYDTATHQILNQWQKQSNEDFPTLLHQNRQAIIDAMTSRLIKTLGSEHEQTIRQTVESVVAQSKPDTYLKTIKVPTAEHNDMVSAVQIALTDKLKEISRNPAPMVAEASHYLETQKTELANWEAKRDAATEAYRNRSKLKKLRDKLPAKSRDIYQTPPVKPADPISAENDIKDMVLQTLRNDFSLPMRAIFFDSGAQLLLTSSKYKNHDSKTHRDTSYSSRHTKQVHLLHNEEPGQPIQALSPHVCLEELHHYIVTDPRITPDAKGINAAWMNATKQDLGIKNQASPDQEAARSILSPHFAMHTPVWARGDLINNYAAELAYEIYQAQQAGVPKDELKKRLPHSYPLYEKLQERINEVGNAILAQDGHAATLAREPSLSHTSLTSPGEISGQRPDTAFRDKFSGRTPNGESAYLGG